MRLAKVRWAFFLLMPVLSFGAIAAEARADTAAADEETPEVTARVARISFLRGEAQIKRASGDSNTGDGGKESDEWERAALNLPLVEGDRIVTEAGARLEIQFDRDSFVRLAENSYLKITTLRDEGVALSLPQGTLSLRVLNFDKNRAFFEIDGPQTTLSVQKTGMYRVDAGERDSHELRVTATDGGEARVYSDNSGFTLRDGRSARVYLEGSYAGEWETSDAARRGDEWDEWVLERDAKIAKILREAHYDKYYDRDMYGAEDLNDHGEWIHTRKYGWVWKPFRNSTAAYADWSPYRYGQWRWIPPYGWTWVNDEPWGWATYHHGRWVYADGEWCWTPYAYHRPRRSWWRPALVVVTWSGRLICWYPLPFHYAYYNYNRHYHTKYIDRRQYHTTIINNNTAVVVNPSPTPNQTSPTPQPTPKGPKLPPFQTIPTTGVVAINAEQFGAKIKGGRGVSAPPEIAREILSKEPTAKAPPILPVGIDRTAVARNDVFVKTPRAAGIEPRVKTGVIERQAGGALDEEIRRQKVFQDRRPVVRSQTQTDLNNGEKPVRGRVRDDAEIRDTGAVERAKTPRAVIKRSDDGDDPNAEVKQTRRQPLTPDSERSTGARPNDRPPVKQQRPREEDQTEKPRRADPPPIYAPRPPRERPKDPPPAPRNEDSRPAAPVKPPRSEPPPQRNEEAKPKPPPTDAKTGRKPDKID